MTVPLIDIQAGFGGMVPGVRGVYSAHELLRELGRLRISGAVVRLLPDSNAFDIPRANDELVRTCAEHPALLACPIALPAACGDVPAESRQVADAIAAGAVAMTLRPKTDYWEPVPWVCGELLRALAARRMPVICPEPAIPLTQIAEFATLCPQLPIVVTDVSYRNHRTLLPLLKTFRSVRLSVGNCFTAHRGIEFYVREVGAERLLFGTGLPESEAGAAVSQLMYADISPEEKALIGAGNLERLREGVLR